MIKSLNEFGLWPHQLSTIKDLRTAPTPRRLLAYEMGCGKTRTASVAMEDDASAGLSEYYFVVCPKAVTGVWLSELNNDRYENLTPYVLDKSYRKLSVAKRHDWLRDRVTYCKIHGRAAVFILNYELISCAKSSRRQAAGAFALLTPPSGIVFDESHWLANASSVRSKSAVKIVGRMHSAALVLCLSGTPVTTCPLTVFTQAQLINPEVFGDSFYAFRKRHTITETIYAAGGRQVEVAKEIVGLDEINRGIESIADVVKCADVQKDLPEVINQFIGFDLGCAKQYSELDSELILQVAEGYVTADNALEKFLRLRMLTSGIVTLDDEVKTIDDSRAGVLSELLQIAQPSAQDQNPVIIFYEFTEELRQIENVCKSLGLTVASISGHDKSGLDIETGKLAEGFDVVAVQLNAGTVGVDLTAASIGIFYRHPIRGWHVLDQAIKRLHRPGQAKPVRCVHISANGTIDEKIYNALIDQRNVADFLINDYRNGKG